MLSTVPGVSPQVVIPRTCRFVARTNELTFRALFVAKFLVSYMPLANLRGTSSSQPYCTLHAKELRQTMPSMRTAVLRALAPALSAALVIGGIDVPHAKVSPTSRALEDQTYPDKWPFDARDLTPQDPSDDQLFYLIPKFVQHAGSRHAGSR